MQYTKMQCRDKDERIDRDVKNTEKSWRNLGISALTIR